MDNYARVGDATSTVNWPFRFFAGAACLTALVAETMLNYRSAGSDIILTAVTLGMPLIALFTVLAAEHGHHVAGWQRIGMFSAAILVTAAVLANGLHRTATAQGAGTAVATSANELRAAKTSERGQLIKDRDGYKQNADVEQRNGGCKTLCLGWQDKAEKASTAIAALDTAIANLPVPVENAENALIAGYIRTNETTVALYRPVVQPLAIATIVLCCGSGAFGPRRRSDPVVTHFRPRVVVNDDMCDVQTALAKAGRPLTNRELASLLKISEGESSKRVTALIAQSPGLIRRDQAGKAKAIRLVS